MRSLLLSLCLLLLGPVSALGLSYEIAGIKVELPGYTEKTDSTTNRIAQKRAWSPKRDVSFAGGSFQHPGAGLEVHVASMLVGATPTKEEYEKQAALLGLPADMIAMIHAEVSPLIKAKDTDLLVFRKIKFGDREGYHMMGRNRTMNILTHTFFLPGSAPREIVQLSFGGEAPILREKDAFLSWLKT